MSDELLTSTAAGLILGVSGRTVVRWTQAGRMKAETQMPGPNGAYLFRRSEITRVERLLAGRAA